MGLISMGVMYSKQPIYLEKSRFSESHCIGPSPSFANNLDYMILGWLQSDRFFSAARKIKKNIK